MLSSMADSSQYIAHLHMYLQRFMPITRGQLAELEPFLEVRRYPRKAIILGKGATEHYINIVLEGLVHKYIKATKGEVTLQLATEGHFIQSEISFHTRKPSEVLLETLEPSIMIAIRYDQYQLALDRVSWLEEMTTIVLTQMFIRKDARYLDQLNKSTRERFLDFTDRNQLLMQRVPQKILASYLNIKPETFSRLKHWIKKK